MADSTYTTGIYQKQGGNEMVIAAAGTLTIEPNATFSLKGSAVTATGAEASLPANQVADYAIVPTAGSANVCNVAITQKDAAAATVAAARPMLIWLSDSATGVGLTGTNASGTVQAKAASGQDMGVLTAKKALMVQPLATGVYTLEITDTAKTGFFVCAQLPNGKVVVSSQLITANYG